MSLVEHRRNSRSRGRERNFSSPLGHFSRSPLHTSIQSLTLFSRMTLTQVNPLDIPELVYRVSWLLPLWEKGDWVDATADLNEEDELWERGSHCEERCMFCPRDLGRCVQVNRPWQSTLIPLLWIVFILDKARYLGIPGSVTRSNSPDFPYAELDTRFPFRTLQARHLRELRTLGKVTSANLVSDDDLLNMIRSTDYLRHCFISLADLNADVCNTLMAHAASLETVHLCYRDGSTEGLRDTSRTLSSCPSLSSFLLKIRHLGLTDQEARSGDSLALFEQP